MAKREKLITKEDKKRSKHREKINDEINKAGFCEPEKKAKKKAKEKSEFIITDGDIVLKRVVDEDHPEVAFHVYDIHKNQILGHAKWTKKGRISGKYFKDLHSTARNNS